METDLLRHGLELTVVGMGTVFVFLTLLVLATSAMSRLVLHLQPVSSEAAALPATEERPEEVAAIAAALEQHRRRR